MNKVTIMKQPSTLFGIKDINYYKIDRGESRVLPWVAADGDGRHRLNYPKLNSSSVVFDVGGYHGDWAEDIFDLYGSQIEVFEPVDRFIKMLEKRFKTNPKINIYQVGLAGKARKVKINVDLAASSIFKNDSGTEVIKLAKAHDFVSKHKKIDLIKLNIEGGEYELLEHFIETGDILKFDNLQIQFHDFVPKAKQQRKKIQSLLSKTHELTFNYPFIWENWSKKND
jgi:FkbM family methyltransferase